MITSLLVKFKHRFPGLWRGVEAVNSLLCRLRYGRSDETVAQVLASQSPFEGFVWERVTPDSASELSAFLMAQSPDHVALFRPHAFDEPTIRRMAGSGGFVMLMVREKASGRVAAYHFLRLFCNGRAFHGLIVAPDFEGRGLGTRLWKIGVEIGAAMRLTVQATISETNIGSLRSCRRGTLVTSEHPLPDGFILLTLTPRRKI